MLGLLGWWREYGSGGWGGFILRGGKVVVRALGELGWRWGTGWIGGGDGGIVGGLKRGGKRRGGGAGAVLGGLGVGGGEGLWVCLSGSGDKLRKGGWDGKGGGEGGGI